MRAVIANHKLEDLIKDRTKIRESISQNMKDQVMGWGVWLETVEITDIQILSGSLFKDLQARFREQEKLTAQIYTSDINNSMNEKKCEYELKMKQIVDKYSLEFDIYKQNSNFRVEDAKLNDEEKKSQIR